MPSDNSTQSVRADERFQRLFDAHPQTMYRLLIDSILSSVVLIDEHLQVVLANRNFLEKTHRNEANTLGKPLVEVFPQVIVEELHVEREIQQVFAGKKPSGRQRLTYRAPGLPLRTYSYSIMPITRGEHVELVMLLMDDITEQLRLTEEIRRVERHLAGVVESASEMVVSTDIPGRILTWNRAAERLSGYRLHEVQGQPLWDYCAEDFRKPLQVFFATKACQSSSHAEYDLLTKAGARITVSWAFSPMEDDVGRMTGIVAVGHDLTERRKLEQELLQSQKLAALGVMAGGIAHEVRTPLAISSSAAQFLMEDDQDPVFRKECAEKVHIGIQRVSRIIENLLRFAHPSQRLDMSEIDLIAVLRDALTLVANQARVQKAAIVIGFSSMRMPVRGNASVLEQVFLNLFLNALNAMPDGGSLTVSADRSGTMASVRVADTGCGIANAEIGQIFDPFYSTLPAGKGTGLGLSICYRVIQQHGGSIEVESAPGRGTTFMVKLPAGEGSPWQTSGPSA
jgi:PAS domain S-box-containing protein